MDFSRVVFDKLLLSYLSDKRKILKYLFRQLSLGQPVHRQAPCSSSPTRPAWMAAYAQSA